jgi:hypothetical protein
VDGLLVGALNFLRSWGQPAHAGVIDTDFDLRKRRYELLEDLYQGVAFVDQYRWSRYRSHHRLYRHVRQVWSHVKALVDFYAVETWPGSIADDGLNLSEGERNAVPLGDDTPVALAKAIGQLWNWWNFQSAKSKIPRWTALYGELLVELRDDAARGKIVLDLVKPYDVKFLHLDESGNPKFYAIEYETVDKLGRYTYRREVDKTSFRTFRNDEPFDFRAYAEFDPARFADGEAPHPLDVGRGGGGAVTPNPYGFVPARWFRHFETSGVRGEPALMGTHAAFDEVNALLSHVLDKAHVGLQSPVVVAGNLAPGALQAALSKMAGAVKRTFTEDLPDGGGRDRESINVVQAPAGTRIETIEIDVEKADKILARLIAALERECPEITMYDKLRNLSQITGPGALPLIGDVDRKLKEVAGSHDLNLKRLLQMGIAMAGWRLQNPVGGWNDPSTARDAFTPYDLDSFAAGKLSFSIKSRVLIPPTARERIELLQLKKSLMPWLPDDQIGLEAGYRADQIKPWIAAWERENEERFARQQPAEDEAPPVRGQPGAPPFGPQGRRPGQPNPKGPDRPNEPGNVTPLREAQR